MGFGICGLTNQLRMSNVSVYNASERTFNTHYKFYCGKWGVSPKARYEHVRERSHAFTRINLIAASNAFDICFFVKLG